MAIPLIPIALVAVSGAFVGSQIDDAVENPTVQNTDPSAKVTTFDFVKFGALAIGALTIYSIARKNGLVK